MRYELFWSFVGLGGHQQPKAPLWRELGRSIMWRRAVIASSQPGVAVLIDTGRDIISSALLPVVEEIERREVPVTLLAVPRAVGAVESLGRRPLVLRAPPCWGAQPTYRRAFAELRAAVPEAVGESDWPRFVSLARRALSVSEEVERVLRGCRARALVVGRDQHLVAASACVAAASLGMPSFTLQHGAVGAFYLPLVSERFIAWGEASRDWLVDAGTDPASVVALGSPRHDAEPSADPEAGHRFRRHLELGDELVFTFFSNSHAPEMCSQRAISGCAAWLTTASTALEGEVSVVVKLHPSEDGRLYSGVPGLRVIKSQHPLPAVLSGSDVIGSFCSTTLQEALLYGKPALQFLAPGWPELVDNWRRGLARRISSSDRLVEELRALRDRDCYRERSRRARRDAGRAFANRGHAADAIADQIAESNQVMPHPIPEPRRDP